MKDAKALTVLALLMLHGRTTPAQEVQYFPNLALGENQREHDFKVDWYTKQLKAMREPSLLDLSKTGEHVYRFLWLRSFHSPVAVRLNITEDGTSVLTAKVTDGKGGYGPGKLIKNETKRITKEQTQRFLDQVRELDYWDLTALESMGDVVGCDGAQWVLEAMKGGRYKVVDRWSPKKGAIRVLGLLMLTDLADLKFSRREVY